MGISHFLYEDVATEIEAQIQKGALASGDKLLSVRQLSREKRISINTVIQAYLLLEQKGVIESRPQSGFYVAPRLSADPVRSEARLPVLPVEVQVSEIVRTVFSASREGGFSELGAGCISPELYPNHDLSVITRKLLRRHPEFAGTYCLPPGDPAYLHQVAKRLSRSGTVLSPNELVATNGAMEAVSLCLRAVCKSGDTVLVESPVYFGILQCLESLNLKVIELPADPEIGIDPDQLRQTLSRKKVAAALLMPNFNNPLGTLMPDENKKTIVSLFQKFGVPVIEDDLYSELAFNGTTPKTLKSFDDSGLVLTCSSFSKTVCPGHRIGWTAPGKFLNRVIDLQLSSTLATTHLPQKLMAEYLVSHRYDRHLRRLRNYFSIQVPRTAQAILEHFPKGTRVTQPKGGYVLWVELPKSVDSVELHLQAFRKKISICPGVIFSASQAYRNYIRLNCGRIWGSGMDRAIRVLASLAHQSRS